MAPTLFTSCNALPPEGALCLRPGKAGSAALAGQEAGSKVFIAFVHGATSRFEGSQR